MSGEILPGNAPCDNHRLRQIIIASYLHDMGKLMRRGGYERKTNLSFTLPTNDVIVGTLKSFSVAHAQHVLEYIFGLGVYQHNKGPKNNVFWQEIALISALHHEKDKTTYITQVTPTLHDAINIVYHADNMSSMERNKKDEDEEKNHHVKTTPMTSIFEVIFGQQEQGGHNQYVYNPHPLSNTTEPIFPSKHRTEVDFASLASGFLTGLDLLMQIGQNFSHHTPLSELDTRISQCDCLCQEYMTLVPSDAYTSNRADVSLYDHTKLVVANAVVLFHTTQTQKHDIKRGQPSATITANLPITLIGTDLPGIQGYLDQAMQTTKGLNKRLRARSLMIQMLNEAIVQFILHKLNLPRANVLINAGGQATIMSHQIDANDIADISDSINMFLLQNFGGYLRAVIGTFDTTMSQIYDKNIKKNDEDTHDTIQQAPFKKALIALKKNLTDGKHRISGKFADTLFDQDNPFRDRGINPSLWQNNADDTPSEGLEEGEINAMMQKERNLGQKIIGLHRGTLSLIYKNSEGQFAFERQDTQTQGSDNIFFLRFNKWWDENDCTKYVVPKSINVFVAKNNNNQVQDFETLASEDYLAYIKGDVDNMSLILGYGFDDDQTGIHNQYSVSRIVSFARLLEYFFGYRTHAFLEKNFAQTSYTVFSGGDDFELIVKYSDAIPLIQSYTKLFHDFVCHNPTIHFSLGMVLFKHKTPMHIVRKQAESCEKSAKKVGKDEMRRIQELDDTKQLQAMGIINLHAKTTASLQYGGICLYQSGYEFALQRRKSNLEKISDTNGNILDIGPYINEEKDFFDTKKHNDTTPKKNQATKDTQIYAIYMLLGDMTSYRESQNYAKYHLTGARVLDMVIRGGGTEKLKNYIKHVLLSFGLDQNNPIIALQSLRLQFLHYLHQKT